MSVLTVALRGTTLRYDTERLTFSLARDGALWQTGRAPFLTAADGTAICFTKAAAITHKPWKTGLGEGFLTRFEGFPGVDVSFETLLWVDNTRGELFAELIPYEDPKGALKQVDFPTAFDFPEQRPDWYTVLPMSQGLIVPNDFDKPFAPYGDGLYYSSDALMPFFGQVKQRSFFIAVCVTPWDGGYTLDNPPEKRGTRFADPWDTATTLLGGPYTVGQHWIPSLGRMDYRRIVRYSLGSGDYNDMAKVYRQYARETGNLVTLAEKAVRNPLVNKLIGSAIVTNGICTYIAPTSRFYDKEHPEKNDVLHHTFDDMARIMGELKANYGLEKVYYHMDGWGSRGYDNQHPDYLPPNERAGGWAGMKRLSDKMKDLGYMFATHDQYRDYYYDADTFDEQMAVRNLDGTVTTHGWWAGGTQTYLCATQAPGYVRRNYTALKEHGIDIEGTYQDVFTICALDECDHPWHRMTRKQCMEYRAACFDWCTAQGIAISSEDAIDWAMKNLVFCHHSPYAASGHDEHRDAHLGIPIPLFNLVYHDCFLQPMNLEKGFNYTGRTLDHENGFLYALLLASPGYLDAQPSPEQVERYKKVARLQAAIGSAEMLRHEYLADGWQRTVWPGGITVTINMEKDAWRVEGVAL